MTLIADNSVWTSTTPFSAPARAESKKMKSPKHYFYLLCILLFTIPAQGSDAGDEPAGHVILVAGTLIAVSEDSSERELKRRSPFFSGDLLRTESGSKAQLRFSDGALIAMREKSELLIDNYRYDKNPESDTNIGTLLKGGMRAITGAIGKENPKAYKLNTPVATIGIRGTVYEAVLGENLDLAVWEGTITVENGAGMLELGAGADFDFAVVRSASTPPQGQIDPPAVFSDSDPTTPTSGTTDNTADQDNPEQGDPEPASTEASPTQETTNTTETQTSPLENSDSTLESMTNPVGSSDPTDPLLSGENTTSDSGSVIDSSGNQDLRLSESEIASLERLGIIVFGGANAREFMGGKSTDGSGGSPVITDNGFGPGEPEFETSPIAYVIRQGDATLDDSGFDPTYGYSWGAWNGTVHGVEIQYDPQDPGAVIMENRPSFWGTLIPTPKTALDSLTGTYTYNNEVVVRGGGSGGMIHEGNFSFSMTVDFLTGSTYGNVDIVTDTNNSTEWHVGFNGEVLGPTVHIPGGLTGTVNGSSTVSGDLGMAFTGNSAEAVGGVFDLQQSDDPNVHAEGVFLIER